MSTRLWKGLLFLAPATAMLCPAAMRTAPVHPVIFEENGGERRSAFWPFLVRGASYSAGIRPNQATFSFRNAGASEPVQVGLRMLGASPGLVEGERQSTAKVSYFLGTDPVTWRSGVRTYSRLRQKAVYPGIDLIYSGKDGSVEMDFVVAPGADPSQIRLEITGGPIHIDDNGDLVVETAAGSWIHRRPVAFQTGNRIVAAFYRVSGNRISFDLGEYDPNKELIIDPVLDFLTYLGGGSWDEISGIATDAFGNIYVAGSTTSPNFPVTPGVVAEEKPGGSDVFVAKFSPDGRQLLYSTYLGAPSSDLGVPMERAAAIAVDAEGNAYVLATGSSSFPTTAAAWKRTHRGFGPVLFKLNPEGTKLVFSTFLAESGLTMSHLGLDSQSRPVIAGSGFSPDLYTSDSAFQKYVGGRRSIYVIGMAADGSQPRFGTLLGNITTNFLRGLFLDSQGNIVLCGYNGSGEGIPATPDALQTESSGDTSGFLSVLSGDASSLIYSTLLGNFVLGCAETTDGRLIVSTSLQRSLPGDPEVETVGPPAQSAALILRLSHDRTRIDQAVRSPFALDALLVDTEDNVYGIGRWSGPEAWLSGGANADLSNSRCLLKLSPDLRRLLYLSPIESARTFALPYDRNPHGGLAVAGVTSRSRLPVTSEALQPALSELIPPTVPVSRLFPVQQDTFVGRFYLSAFRDSNFLLKWNFQDHEYRLGDPLKELPELPILDSGEPLALQVTSTFEGVEADVVGGSPRVIQPRLIPAQLSPMAKTRGALVIVNPDLPESELRIPFFLTVRERPVVRLEKNHVKLATRQGVPVPGASVQAWVNPDAELEVRSDQPGWLFAGVSRNGPGEYRVEISASPRPLGNYRGKLMVLAKGADLASAHVIDVEFEMLPEVRILAQPLQGLSLFVRAGSATPGVLEFRVDSDPPNQPFSIRPGHGLAAGRFERTSEVTPATLRFIIEPADLPARIYAPLFSILNASGNGPHFNLTVSVYDRAVQATPPSLVFTYFRGKDAPLPTNFLQLFGSGPHPVKVSATPAWIDIPLVSTTLPAGSTVSIRIAGLPAGTHRGNILVDGGGASANVAVTLNLIDLAPLTITPASISIRYRQGQAAPVPVLLESNSDFVTYRLRDPIPALRLSVIPGSNPFRFTITIDPGRVQTGTFRTSAVFESTNRTGTVIVPITLEVLPAQ